MKAHGQPIAPWSFYKNDPYETLSALPSLESAQLIAPRPKKTTKK